jgi:BMFP domain-containing protein YqiC
VGRPILEGLLKEIDKRKLEDWEPELCARAVGALAATYRALGTDVEKSVLLPVQNRLCRLDPVTALKWSGS